MNKKVIIIDLDGTVSDSKWRNKFIPSNGGTWEKFHESCDKDKPIEHVVEIVESLSHKYEIVGSTARPIYVKDKTWNWILGELEFDISSLYMRNMDQMSLSSPNLKYLHLKSIKDFGREIHFAIDDREDVCQMYRENGVRTLCVGDIIGSKKQAVLVKDAKTPDQLLSDAADLFKSRNPVYGDSYKKFGPVMKGLFPDGLTLKTKADFQRFSIIVMMAAKLHRYSLNFSKGHEDSLDDLSVYSMMLQHIDKELL